MLDQTLISYDLPDPPIAQSLGLMFISGLLGEFQLDEGPQHDNPMGTLHGGVLCDLANLEMGAAFVSTLSREETLTTQELRIHFLGSVWKEKLFAASKIVHRDLSVGMVECDITDSQGRLVAKTTSTCMTLQKKASK